ncbi:MAG: alanine dehydrogenase [Acidobacteriota bacterium]|nr:alanine dehydrogenase [Thermoanaerobaculaceae bacterium]
MIIGVPKECSMKNVCEEERVSLVPPGVRELVELGAEVLVETGAGMNAGFADELYEKVGAKIIYSREEVFGRSDAVVKVSKPTPQEIDVMQNKATLLAFLHLAVSGESYIQRLIQKEITAIGYETIQDKDGYLPILKTSSEIAAKMAPQIAGKLLETTSGGLGILLGGAPGIPPADIVIIGGGTLGYHAARAFLGLGCSVYVLDISQRALERIDQALMGRVTTAFATKENIEKYVSFAEVLIGAVLVPGQVAPIVVTKEMVQKMRKGTVIIDFSFDQGGCIETTRLQGPSGGIFVREGVLHFAVPNCPSYVARTSSYALTNSLLPFLISMQKKGIRKAMREWKDLQRGCYLYEGKNVSRHISEKPMDLEKLLGEE